MKNYLKIISLEEVDSTNNYALNLAQQGAQEITVVSANHQTKGRGTKDRVWQSPKDKGLYVSFILRPENKLADFYYLPFISALAVAQVIKNKVTPKLKWPNDVLVNSKKIAGVLVETRSSGQKIEYAVVGIGLNVNSQRDDIIKDGTSLLLETGKVYSKKEILEGLISQFINLYSKFKNRCFSELYRDILFYIDKERELENFWVNSRGEKVC